MPASRQLYVITGVSRGLGAALAQTLLSQPQAVTLLGVGRAPNPTLSALAQAQGQRSTDWTVDLAQSPVDTRPMQDWLREERANSRDIAGVTFIYNAGVIPTIAPLSELSGEDVSRTLRVNLEAALQLSAVFLKSTADGSAPRKVVFVSSGLGRRPMASQVLYCASKAGLDHAARCLALEQARERNGARVCALAPGVIDTDMQVQLRAASTDHFPDRGRFDQLKSQGQLDSAQAAAQKVLAYLARADFGAEPVGDVRL